MSTFVSPRLPALLGRIALAAACLCLCLAPSARGQDEDEGELERVLRDQGRITLRLDALREKMTRLADRYDGEGRERNAELLRTAVGRFEEEALLARCREIEQSLEGSLLASVEQQDVLSGALEGIYSLLRDRRDVDELRTRVDLVNEALTELKGMSVEQRRLLSESRAATDTSEALVDEAMKEAARVADSLEDAAEAVEQMVGAEEVLGDAALAERLAVRQRALSRDPGATVDDQRALEETLAALRERLEEPLEQVGGSEHLGLATALREEAARAGLEAARAMEAARSALAGETAPTESGSNEAGPNEAGPNEAGPNEAGPNEAGSSEAGSSEAGEGSEASSAGQTSSGDEASPGETSSTSGESSTSSSAAGESAASEGSQASPSGTPSEGTPAEGSPREGASATSQGEPSAPEDSGESPPQVASGQPREAEARAAMETAAERLEDVRDALADAERTLAAARNRARAGALASSSLAKDQGETLDDLSQRLETLEPDAGPELLNRTRELLDDLASLEQALERGDTGGASQAARAAQLDLNQLLQQLQQRAGESPSQGAQGLSPEQLAAQADSQQDLERRVRELMDRLREVPDQAFQEDLEQAGESMAAAEQSLRGERPSEAGRRQEEAAEKLEEAAEKLSGERDRYEQLRQEEILFRLGEELQSLLTDQVASSAETEELEEARTEGGRLTRGQRRTLARLADQERELATRATTVRDELDENGAVVFVYAMQQTADDLGKIAAELADLRTDVFVQATQADVEARLADLLAILDDELERRRQAASEPQESQPGGEQQPQGPPPLVPPVAELLLIQRMEYQALARLDRFEALHPELQSGELADPERQILERWALDHSRVTGLFESMLPEPPAPELDVAPHGPGHGGHPPEGGELHPPGDGADEGPLDDPEDGR